MRFSMPLKMKQRTLLLAVIATFAAGCSTTPTYQYEQPYRDYSFGGNSSTIQSADSNKASEIANYVSQNQYERVGIDGLLDPKNVDLSNRRVSAVREALIRAGVPDYKIRYGAFGDPQQRLNGKVAVLVGK